jgi:ketosteroid isomerase-like protein
MSDESAIQQLLNRYTDGCNRRDWGQVMASFTEDAAWGVAGRESYQGHAAIRAEMESFVARLDYFVQLNTPAVIEINGDTASARSTIRECGRFAGTSDALEVLGFYDDELMRTPGGWRFTRRRFNSLGLHRFSLLAGPPLG